MPGETDSQGPFLQKQAAVVLGYSSVMAESARTRSASSSTVLLTRRFTGEAEEARDYLYASAELGMPPEETHRFDPVWLLWPVTPLRLARLMHFAYAKIFPQDCMLPLQYPERGCNNNITC